MVWWLIAAPAGALPLAFAALLIWVSCRDIAVFEVPDVAAALLVVVGVSVATDVGWALVAVVLWGGLFLGMQQGAAKLLGQPALGLGDVKLMAGLAAWLGVLAPIYVTLYASLAAIVTLMAIALVRGEKLSNIPGSGIAFGPFLCLSAWGVWLWGAGV